MKALGKIFDFVSIAFTALFALLIVGLGYFFMNLALHFGWFAVLGLVCLIAIAGVIEGSIMAIITAPYTIVATVIRARSKTESAPVDPLGSKLLSSAIMLLMVVGAILATLQYIIQGSPA